MTGGDDHTWRDELRAELVHAFLSKALGAAAREEIDLPHIVVCRDPSTGAVSYSGPFEDGLAALVVAEREADLDRQVEPGEPMEFSVAALLPATCPVTRRDP